MTSKAFLPANVAREIVCPVTTSGSWKSGAFVPISNIVEEVKAMAEHPL
jgi:hypothetical protein